MILIPIFILRLKVHPNVQERIPELTDGQSDDTDQTSYFYE